MSTVAGGVLPRRCCWLCLATWVAGFMLLCVVHLHMKDSVEIHRYKHTFDDDELLLMSLQATEYAPVVYGTVHPPNPNGKANTSTETHRENNVSNKTKQQNTESDRFRRLTDIQHVRTKNTRDVCLKRRQDFSSNHGTGRKLRPQSPTNPISTLSLRTLKHIYVSDKHSFMYCYIPTTGCSYWKRVMMFLKNPWVNIEDISSREAHYGLKTLKNFSPEERKWRLKNYKKFMFVRNPVSRIVSVYRNKLRDLGKYRSMYGIRQYGQHIVKKYRRNATSHEIRTGENVTWFEWIAYLTNQVEEANFGDHWMQMSKLCSPCDVEYDYIGKLESFGDDADYIMSALNLTNGIAKFPQRENNHLTNTSIDVSKSYFEGVSKRKRRELWNTYKLDFQLFGYEEPDF